MSIRHANPTDHPFIKTLGEDAFRHYGGNAAATCMAYVNDPFSVTLIAEDDDNKSSVGFAIVQPSPRHTYIAAIAVTPSHRRRGIAKSLLAECINLAEQQASRLPYSVDLHVGLNNHAAIALFKSLGFRAHQWTRLAYKSGELAVPMEKTINGHRRRVRIIRKRKRKIRK